MKRFFASLLGFSLLIACSEPSIGPDEALLYGTWAQDGVAQADPTLIVSEAVITYAPDGQSSFTGVMAYAEAGMEPILFDIAADVAWQLDETIITRTLQDVDITPRQASPDGEAYAAAFEDAYRSSPPGRLIVQFVDPNELIVLDADTNTMLRYLKRPEGTAPALRE